MHSYKGKENCFKTEIKTEPEHIRDPIESNYFSKYLKEEQEFNTKIEIKTKPEEIEHQIDETSFSRVLIIVRTALVG